MNFSVSLNANEVIQYTDTSSSAIYNDSEKSDLGNSDGATLDTTSTVDNRSSFHFEDSIYLDSSKLIYSLNLHSFGS